MLSLVFCQTLDNFWSFIEIIFAHLYVRSFSGGNNEYLKCRVIVCFWKDRYRWFECLLILLLAEWLNMWCVAGEINISQVSPFGRGGQSFSLNDKPVQRENLCPLSTHSVLLFLLVIFQPTNILSFLWLFCIAYSNNFIN